MRLIQVLLASFWLVPVAFCSTEIHVYHRISRGHGHEPKPDFTLRGSVFLEEGTGSAKYASTSDSKLDLGSEDFHDCCLYELALEKPGVSQKHWSFTSTKACFLSARISDSIGVVLNERGVPISLNYHIEGVPSNGACPSSGHAHSHTHHQGHGHGHSHTNPSSMTKFAVFANTTATVRRPNSVRLPILKAPPAMTPEGKPVVPPPEKSFIQKYWIYAIPIVIILLFAPEDDAGAPAAAK